MSRRRIKKKKNFLVFILLIVIVVFLIIGIAFKLYLSNAGKPFNPSSEDYVAFIVQSGSGTSTIAQQLEDKGIIASADSFKLISRIAGYDGKYKAGTFSMSPSMSAKEIMEALVAGNDETMRITVQEGLTVAQTADKLATYNSINRENFMNEATNGTFDYRFMQYLPSGENRLEGFLFPETYDFFTNATEHDIIDRMLKQFDTVFNDDAYARAQELGYTPYQIVIIASIIEKEAKVDGDRALISSVIYNRLDVGMQLQMCSTVLYALGDNKGYVTTKDTQYDSPYNTYMYAGLPPGPIASPGADSIHAALYPENTDYLYFVVKPDKSGAHNFSSTYEQFLRDKEAYQASL